MSQQKQILFILPRSRIEERDEFIRKVWKLSKLYGYNQILLAFSVP